MSVATAIDSAGGRAVPGNSVADRLAGAGGLIFVGTLVVQNVLRANAPGFDATPAEVATYFGRAGAAVLVPLGLFPVEMLAVFLFVGAIWTRADRDDNRWWASVGALGAASIAALFAIVNISEIVLTSKAEQLATAPAVIQSLWTLHAAAFGLDLAAIAVALIGLSRAARSIALIPRWIAVAALPGAACLLTASVFTIALTQGGAGLLLGLVGFSVWLVFVATASISLLRGRQIAQA